MAVFTAFTVHSDCLSIVKHSLLGSYTALSTKASIEHCQVTMASAAKEEDGAWSTTDVTVYLVPKSTADQGNVTKKRKVQSVEPGEQNESLQPLAKIHLDSSKLRECSKYFQTCMSGRWTANTQTVFHLEVHTEVRFYRECFYRMYFPFKPIGSVGECIELLKVASQIDYAQVLDIGVQYLAAVPWSDEEEKQICEFYASGQLSSNSAKDLSERLELPLNISVEIQKNCLERTQRVLRRSLQLSTISGIHLKLREESRKVFTIGFQAILAGSGPGKCGKVLQNALTLVAEESYRLLSLIKGACRDTTDSGSILALSDGILDFCWLFSKLRKSNATQAVVKQILNDEDIASCLQTKFQTLSIDTYSLILKPVLLLNFWAELMSTIFQDVLDGQLFLKTPERLALFQRWNWLLKVNLGNCDPDAAFRPTQPRTQLVSRFISSFPHKEQEEIYRRWVSNLDDPAHQADYNLSRAHSKWMKHLVSQAEKLDPLNCSDTDGDSVPAAGASSSGPLVMAQSKDTP